MQVAKLFVVDVWFLILMIAYYQNRHGADYTEHYCQGPQYNQADALRHWGKSQHHLRYREFQILSRSHNVDGDTKE